MSIRRRSIAAPLGLAAVLAAALALLPGALQHAARADTNGTPVNVGATGCIVVNGGNVTRPAGSTIIVRYGFTTPTLGELQHYLQVQTTAVGISDGQMVDYSHAYGAPVQDANGIWGSFITVNTGVTVANPGDQMRFTFANVLSAKVTEVPAPAGGAPGPPVQGGPGLAFGGTCTVTAT